MKTPAPTTDPLIKGVEATFTVSCPASFTDADLALLADVAAEIEDALHALATHLREKYQFTFDIAL
jgi:hypothetical protein